MSHPSLRMIGSVALLLLCSLSISQGHAETQPQLFGAELQYFRLRGGAEKNVPREKVINLWNRALDQMVEAKMNVVSFSIPWDFHEYAEGKFDFAGSVDEDGDGHPDYPSRDLFAFFRLIEEHGIKKIIIRPGPEIHAAWGSSRMGAIPLWFHEKYPDSHLRNTDGLRTQFFSYDNADFLRHTQLWFKELYEKVLKNYLGAEKPIFFIQLDIETRPPNQDPTVDRSLWKLRKIWESLGVTEPQVHFAVGESPKTTDPAGILALKLDSKTFIHHPFQSDPILKTTHAALGDFLGDREISLETRKQTYLTALGHGLKALIIDPWTDGDPWQTEWLKKQIGPHFRELRESSQFSPLAFQPDRALPSDFWKVLQKTIDEKLFVGIDARAVWLQDQTGLTHLDSDAPLNIEGLPGTHYALLKEVGEKLIAPHQDFLAQATTIEDPVAILKDSELASASPSPLAQEGLDTVKMNTDWMSGLLGYVLQTGFHPKILQRGTTPDSEVWKNRVIFYSDPGVTPPSSIADIKKFIQGGGVWVNLLADSVAQDLGFLGGKTLLPSMDPISEPTLRYTFFLSKTGDLAGSSHNQDIQEVNFTSPNTDHPLIFRYPAISKGCAPILFLAETPVAFRCPVGKGMFYQIGALLYSDFNSARYATLKEAPQLRQFIEGILHQKGLRPTLRVIGADRVVAFGRRLGTRRSPVWITAKNGQNRDITGKLQAHLGFNANQQIQVTNLFSGVSLTLSGKELDERGFTYRLPAYGSKAYLLTPLSGRKF